MDKSKLFFKMVRTTIFNYKYKKDFSQNEISLKTWDIETDQLYGPSFQTTKNKSKTQNLENSKDSIGKITTKPNAIVSSVAGPKEIEKNSALLKNTPASNTLDVSFRKDESLEKHNKENKSRKKELKEKNNRLKTDQNKLKTEKLSNKLFKSKIKEEKLTTPKIIKKKKEPTIKKSTSKTSAPFVLDVDNLEEDSEDEFFDYQPASEEDLKEIMKGTFVKINSSDKFHSASKIESIKDFTFILEQPFYPSAKDISKSDNINWQLDGFIPSVSNILKSTMSDESARVLEEWQKKKISELGEEGFQQFQSKLFQTGSDLHQCIQTYLLNHSDLNLSPSIEGYWKSIEWVMDDISDVVSMETPVSNNTLKYKGIFDCIASYKGTRCMIEWKTSQRRKTSLQQTYDNPLQVVAYMAAFNESLFHLSTTHPSNTQTNIFNSPTLNNSESYITNNFTHNQELVNKHPIESIHSTQSVHNVRLSKPHDSINLTPVNNGLLVITYGDGTKADVHMMGEVDCHKYWRLWTQRLHKYWSQIHQCL